MTATHLRFSAGSLLGKALLLTLAATAFVAISLDLHFGGSAPRWIIFRLLGPTGTKIFFLAASLLVVLTALAIWRRLLGSRIAAAICDDGIELRGVFMSRHIPWGSLDRLYLRPYRRRGETGYFIKADSRCPPGKSAIHHALASLSYGVSTALLEGPDEDAARWLNRALAARESALRSRSGSRVAGVRAPASGHWGGLGRRNG